MTKAVQVTLYMKGKPMVKHPDGMAFFYDLSATAPEYALAEVLRQTFERGVLMGKNMKAAQIRSALLEEIAHD